LILSATTIAFAAGRAEAYLGGFEPADGYTINQIPGSPPSDFIDVTYYNAGQWGANAGGGGTVPRPLNDPSNLWQLLTSPGAYFPNTATRNTYVSSAPPYPPFPSTAGVPIYAVGNHFMGRTGTCLALRNETFSGYGPMEYDSKLDTFDFGGPAPASVTTGIVSTGFYFCPNPSMPSQPGTQSPQKFIMSFRDSAGATGLQLGYAQDNTVYWRPGSSGAWTYTSTIADSSNYDGFTVNIDLTNDTFELKYFDFSASNTLTFAPAGTALGAPMTDLTHLRWYLTDQVSGGVGGKNFFDDFSFRVNQVPEPASMMLTVLGGSAVASVVRRRKRLRSSAA
jgi:hypothetical protein